MCPTTKNSRLIAAPRAAAIRAIPPARRALPRHGTPTVLLIAAVLTVAPLLNARAETDTGDASPLTQRESQTPAWWERAERIVGEVLNTHPALEATAARVQAQTLREEAAGTDRPATQLGVMAGALPVETREGPIFAQLSITQPLPNFAARRAAERRAEARTTVLQCDEANAALDLQRATIEALVDLDAATYGLVLTERYLALAHDLREALEREAGHTADPALALYRAALLEDTLRRQRDTLEGERETAAARLRSLLPDERTDALLSGRDAGESDAARVFLNAPSHTEDELDALISNHGERQELLTSTPAQLRYDATASEALAAADEAGATRRATWALQATWSSVGVRELSGGMQTGGRDALTLGVMVNLPTSPANRSRRQAARYDATASTHAAAATLREEDATFSAQLSRARAAARSLASLRDTTLPLLRSLQSQLTTRAAQGRSELSDIADAATDALRAELDAIALARESLRALAGANRISGGQLFGEGVDRCDASALEVTQ